MPIICSYFNLTPYTSYTFMLMIPKTKKLYRVYFWFPSNVVSLNCKLWFTYRCGRFEVIPLVLRNLILHGGFHREKIYLAPEIKYHTERSKKEPPVFPLHTYRDFNHI